MSFPKFRYFAHHLNREVKEVYWFAAINSLALALVYVFEPIFLYQLGYSIPDILWYYALVYVSYMILVFPAAKFASKFGYKHSILIASIFYVLYWTTLYQIKFYPALFLVAPIFFALQKSFFWPAYNADVAMASAKNQRGREVGVLLSEIEVFSILGPFLGGVISARFGFSFLFGTAATLMVMAVYPLFKSPDIYAKHEFRFKNFRQIFSKYKWNFFGYWGYAEDLMLMSLWPITIFGIVQYFVSVGSIVTFASLTAAVLMLYIGRVADRLPKPKLIRFASVAYGITWLLRFLGQGAASILAFDILTKTGKAAVNVPMVSLTYDLAGSKSADHAIAYSVFYEFSLSAGKVVTALGAIWIFTQTNNVNYVFAFVGVLTMFYGLLRNK